MRDFKLQPRVIKIIFLKATHLHLLLHFKGRSGISFHPRRKNWSCIEGNSFSWHPFGALYYFVNRQPQALHWTLGLKRRKEVAPSILERLEHHQWCMYQWGRTQHWGSALAWDSLGLGGQGEKASLTETGPELCLILSVGTIENRREDRRNPQEHFVKITLYLKVFS